MNNSKSDKARALTCLLERVEWARDTDPDSHDLAIKVGDIRQDLNLEEPQSDLLIASVLEDPYFHHQAQAVMVHRVGVRGGVETVYIFRLLPESDRLADAAFWQQVVTWRDMPAILSAVWRNLSFWERTSILLFVLGGLLLAMSWAWTQWELSNLSL